MAFALKCYWQKHELIALDDGACTLADIGVEFRLRTRRNRRIIASTNLQFSVRQDDRKVNVAPNDVEVISLGPPTARSRAPPETQAETRDPSKLWNRYRRVTTGSSSTEDERRRSVSQQ